MKTLGIILAAILVVWTTGYILAHRGLNKPDDVLIRELLIKGEQSIESKDSREAASCISPSYHSQPGGNYDGIKLIIFQAFTMEWQYDCQVDVPKVNVVGDNATADTKVTLYSINGNDRDMHFSKDVKLLLKKEPTKRYWIYTIKEWKLMGIDGLGFISSGDAG